MRDVIEVIRKQPTYIQSLNTYLDKYFNNTLFVADSIYNSNKIEGSSLSLGQTLEVLNTQSSQTVEEKEVIGLNKAMKYLSRYCACKPEISDLLILHELLMEDVRPEIAGKYRTKDAYTDTTIRRHYYMDANSITSETEKLFDGEVRTLEDVILFKLKFSAIHPFADGNGRVSRLMLNWMLIQIGYPPVTIKGGNHSRDLYINAMSSYSSYRDVSKLTELLEEELVSLMKIFVLT